MLIIPFTWAIIGFSAALKLGIYEDTGLIISALVLSVLNLIKHTNNHINRYEFGKIAKV